jgi:hypothetical protein
MIGAFALTSENCTHLFFALNRTWAWVNFNAKVSRKKDRVALNGFSYRVKALTFEYWIISVLQFVKNILAKLNAVFAAEAVMRSFKAVALCHLIKKSQVPHIEYPSITKRL